MTSVERPDTTRQRAAEAGARVRYEDMFNDPDDDRWDEVDPAERRDWIDVMDIGLAAAVPVVLADIEAIGKALLSTASSIKQNTEFGVGYDQGVVDFLAEIETQRRRNGWSRD